MIQKKLVKTSPITSRKLSTKDRDNSSLDQREMYVLLLPSSHFTLQFKTHSSIAMEGAVLD